MPILASAMPPKWSVRETVRPRRRTHASFPLLMSFLTLPPGGSDAVAAGEGTLSNSYPDGFVIAPTRPARFLATLPKGGYVVESEYLWG